MSLEDRIDWSRDEVEAVVADYLHMLALELAGQTYSKTAHRRLLLPKLHDRSDGSVELKHQNISAALIELGAPWIIGYKPRKNYQRLLLEVVAERLQADRQVDEVASAAVEQPAIVPAVPIFSDFIVPPPSHVAAAADSQAKAYVRRASGVRRDYLGLETRNRSLGMAGEQFVVAYERYRLHEVGARHLVDRVEQVSVTKGDGLGYDVLSFDADGKERLIEVKTTAFGREAPFYVTRTELDLSKAEPESFRLYRLFEFRRKPRMFELAGTVTSHCALDPVSYLARFV
jgi:Domain of unknown function (DUF3883)